MKRLIDRIDEFRGKLMAALREPESLKQRTFNASFWSAAAMGVQFPLRLISNVALAHILAPEAFGLMATVATLHVGLAMISDIGLQSSVTRSPHGADPEYLRVVWTVQIVRALGIAGALCATGALILAIGPRLFGPSTVYADPRLPWLIMVSAIAVAMQGFQSAAVLLARREMRIARVVRMEIATQVLSIAAMVTLAWMGLGVWALVLGLIVGALLNVAWSHKCLPGPRMTLEWDRKQAAGMWSFGRWLIGSSIGGYLLNQGDRLVFGALLDAPTFGVYAIAAVWASIGGELLQRIAGATIMPALSDLNIRNPDRAQAVLRRLITGFSFASISAALITILAADPIIRLLYSDEYHGSLEIINILVLRLLFSGMRPLSGYFESIGNSKILFSSNFISGAISIIIPIWINQIFGIEAAIFSFCISPALTTMILLLHGAARVLRDRWLYAFWLSGLVAAACIAFTFITVL